MRAFDDPVGRLRVLGLMEGVSFLVLLIVAMPLKYFFAFPEAVTLVGFIHGLLFILFCLALINAWRARRWPIGRVIILLVAALLPGGPFVIDRRLRSEIQPLQSC